MIVSHLLEACIVITLRIILSMENKRRDKIQGREEGGLEARDLDSTAFSDMTDRENLNFRYKLDLCLVMSYANLHRYIY